MSQIEFPKNLSHRGSTRSLYTLLIRLKNTSETLSMEARLAVIDEFTQQVLACDYSKEADQENSDCGACRIREHEDCCSGSRRQHSQVRGRGPGGETEEEWGSPPGSKAQQSQCNAM